MTENQTNVAQLYLFWGTLIKDALYCSSSYKSPDTIKNFSGGKDPDVDVRNDDVVEVAELLVLEEGVRHPDPVRVGHRQVLQFAWKVVGTFGSTSHETFCSWLNTLQEKWMQGECVCVCERVGVIDGERENEKEEI